MKHTIKHFINGKVTYDKDGQYFFVNQPNGHQQMLGELRGWGHIQNMFVTKTPNQHGVFDMEAAARFQDELGQFVADAINEKILRS